MPAVKSPSTSSSEWTTVSLILIFGHFVVPFLLLVSRMIKRRPLLLALTGGYVALMCWIDIFWLVIQHFGQEIFCDIPIPATELLDRIRREISIH